MTPHKKRNRLKNNLILVVGCLVSAGMIYYATRGVDWRQFGLAFKKFHIVWLVPALATFYYSMYLRAVRWGLLFRPTESITGRQAFGPIMIGFAFNSILPMRVGEVARCVAMDKAQHTGIPKALATVAAERILDGLSLLGLLSLSLSMVPIDKSVSYHWKNVVLNADLMNRSVHKLVVACVILIVGVVLVLLPPVERLVLRAIDAMTFLPVKPRAVVAKIFMELTVGFQSFKQPWPMAQIIFYTFVLWILVGVSNVAAAWGFGMTMNLWQGMALVTLIGIAILIPAAPGYWGLYEAGVIFSLMVLGVEKDASVALAYGLVIHMIQWGPVVLIGLACAARAQARLAAGDEKADSESLAE
jgi:uncharacterized protein (TIRG00374 family)